MFILLLLALCALRFGPVGAITSFVPNVDCIANFERLRRACHLTSVNEGGCYLVTPAHVALHPKEKKWQLSHFLNDFKCLDWRISYSY